MKNDEYEKTKKIVRKGKSISRKYPFLRPLLIAIKKITIKPSFSGWGMTTEHEFPWIDEYQGEVFQKASKDIKNNFVFPKFFDVNSQNVDTLLWRNWIVSYAVRHAIKFTKSKNYNFAECGVAIGISTFFALREAIVQQKITDGFSMHLYDSWDAMRKEDLLKSELSSVGRYEKLEIETTKKNLSEFDNYISYHQGYIPESFTSQPSSPERISFLHIDLNSAKPTKDALEFFYPRLESGGTILFDDYGWVGYEDTKIVVDEFFHTKPGLVFKLPTGQAVYFHQ